MRRQWANILSYIFHPVLYPILGVWMAMWTHPGHISLRAQLFSLLFVLTGTYLIPVIISFGLYKLGLIQSLEMRLKKERRIPYLVGSVCYYVTALLLKQLGLPPEAYLYLMAAALIIVVHLMLFVWLKPSAHLASNGGFTALLIYLALHWHLALLFPIAASIIVAGFVGAARLKLEAHTNWEVALGYFSGFAIVLTVLLLI